MPTLRHMPGSMTIRLVLTGLLLTTTACSDNDEHVARPSAGQETEQETEQESQHSGPVSATDSDNADMLFRHFSQYLNPTE